MAKKVVATLKSGSGNKAFTKCIKMVKSEKTGAYTFKTEIVATEEVKNFFSDKK